MTSKITARNWKKTFLSFEKASVPKLSFQNTNYKVGTVTDLLWNWYFLKKNNPATLKNDRKKTQELPSIRRPRILPAKPLLHETPHGEPGPKDPITCHAPANEVPSVVAWWCSWGHLHPENHTVLMDKNPANHQLRVGNWNPIIYMGFKIYSRWSLGSSSINSICWFPFPLA